MTNTNTPNKSGRGCLFWGSIIAGILVVCVAIAIFAGIHYVRGMLDQYTDTKPIEAPAVQLSEMEITNLQNRVQGFGNAMRDGKPVAPLVLTAEEINALIAKAVKTNAAPPVRLYFSFNEDRVQAQLSIPTDPIAEGLGLRMLRGRYLNGSGDFKVSLHDGKLMLNVNSLSVKGKPLPEQFMQSIRTENFADSWTNDTNFTEVLAKLQEIRIESGKLYVIPKTNAPDATPEVKPEAGAAK